MRIALTGATVGVGRELCAEARARVFRVRALVRDLAAASALARDGVELVRGDLETTRALVEVAEGADVFIHTAAHVGDWGSRDDFERVNVGGTRNAVLAAASAKVPRFVHVSSVAVYGRPREGVIDETFPIRPVGTPYEDTKIAAEAFALERGRELGLAVSAVRPPVIVGEHDRVFLPRIVKQLRQRTALLIDGGAGLFNMVDVRDVVDVLLRCASNDSARGEVFNVAAAPPRIRDLFDAIADAVGAPRPRLSVPRAPAMAVAKLLDKAWKLAKVPHPPPVTPFVVTMMTLRVVYDAAKARRVLGWAGAGDPLVRVRELARRYAR
jgi:2-alkyl-3-oxoalkanoate reductase